MSSKSKKILGLITIVVLLLICIGGSETSAVSNIPQITVSNTSANRVNSNTAASGAFVPFFIVQALTSGSPAVKNDINPNKL